MILSQFDSSFLVVHNQRFSLHECYRDMVCIWSLSLHEFDGLILIESNLVQMIKVLVMMFMGNLVIITEYGAFLHNLIFTVCYLISLKGDYLIVLLVTYNYIMI